VRALTFNVLAIFCLAFSASGFATSAADSKAFFLDHSASNRMRAFRNYPLDEQVDIFFYGSQSIHPPAIYLADCFALGGRDAVEVLRSRLRVPGSDLDTRDMAQLILAIQTMGTYDVRADSHLLGALRGRISSMRDAGWRETAKSILEDIESDALPRRDDAPQCSATPN
jgi:hypothetical protein